MPLQQPHTWSVLQAKLAYDELVYGSALEAGGYGNPMNDSRVPDIILKVPAGASSAVLTWPSASTRPCGCVVCQATIEMTSINNIAAGGY
jgi:hypothetical protein